jgi:hypothetical protein
VNSIEKVGRLRQRLYQLQPEDESSAQALQLLVAFSPALVKLLPSDPAELDRYLRTVAWAALQCRSDDAQRLGLFEWDGEAWQPVETEME